MRFFAGLNTPSVSAGPSMLCDVSMTQVRTACPLAGVPRDNLREGKHRHLVLFARQFRAELVLFVKHLLLRDDFLVHNLHLAEVSLARGKCLVGSEQCTSVQ
jgi:hypothetical protein